MKLLWDATGTEFGGRHELYERNYAGNNEATRFENITMLNALGKTDEMKAFADSCMAGGTMSPRPVMLAYHCPAS